MDCKSCSYYNNQDRCPADCYPELTKAVVIENRLPWDDPMLNRITDDLRARLSGQINSLCATDDEVSIAWLVSEIMLLEISYNTDKKVIDDLKNLVTLARNEYLEAHSDGETDCVTPYDIYGKRT